MGKAIVVPGADFSAMNLGSVTPSGSLPIESITISGPASVNGTARYTADITPIFTTQRSLVWSISSGAQYAEIDQDGNVIVTPETDHETITIKCESAANPAVYDEKQVVVSALELLYKTYVETDGTDCIVMPGLNAASCRITIRTTITGSNAYAFMSAYTANSAAPKILAYADTQNNVASNLSGNKATFGAKVSGRIYRFVFDVGAVGSNNTTLSVYDDTTDVLLGSVSGKSNYMNGLFYIFSYGGGAPNTTPTITSPSLCPPGARFYGMKVEKDGQTLAEYKPCIYAGMPGVVDVVTSTFRSGIVGNGGITAGD